MATIIPSGKHEDDKPELIELLSNVIPQYASKWEILGSALGLEQYTIDNISANNKYNPNRVQDCCTDMLKKWLKINRTASWSKLVAAINIINPPLPESAPTTSRVQIGEKRRHLGDDVWIVEKRCNWSDDDDIVDNGNMQLVDNMEPVQQSVSVGAQLSWSDDDSDDEYEEPSGGQSPSWGDTLADVRTRGLQEFAKESVVTLTGLCTPVCTNMKSYCPNYTFKDIALKKAVKDGGKETTEQIVMSTLQKNAINKVSCGIVFEACYCSANIVIRILQKDDKTTCRDIMIEEGCASIGSVVGGSSLYVVGTLAGGALGSVLPGSGTAIGSFLGGAAANAVGGVIGSLVAKRFKKQ